MGAGKTDRTLGRSNFGGWRLEGWNRMPAGSGNKEVAATLDISVRTVEAHRTKIMLKLGIHSFAELVRYAVRNGLIEA